MVEEETRLRFALIAQVGNASRDFSAIDVSRAVAGAAGLDINVFPAVASFPECFLILCSSQEARDLALGMSPIPLATTFLSLRPWTRLNRASSLVLYHKIGIELDGIPEHAWDLDNGDSGPDGNPDRSYGFRRGTARSRLTSFPRRLGGNSAGGDHGDAAADGGVPASGGNGDDMVGGGEIAAGGGETAGGGAPTGAKPVDTENPDHHVTEMGPTANKALTANGRVADSRMQHRPLGLPVVSNLNDGPVHPPPTTLSVTAVLVSALVGVLQKHLPKAVSNTGVRTRTDDRLSDPSTVAADAGGLAMRWKPLPPERCRSTIGGWLLPIPTWGRRPGRTQCWLRQPTPPR
ncbi:unnamed protein product [Urochloa humidicola]